MQKREQYRHVFRDGMKGNACGTGLKELLEHAAQASTSIQGNLERKSPMRRRHRKSGVKGVKRQIFLFSTLPRIGIQVYLGQK